MYEFILWMCLASAPECPVYDNPAHMVYIAPAKSMDECEAMWKRSQITPDGPTLKSRYLCQAVETAL